jgi:hypothetical protein
METSSASASGHATLARILDLQFRFINGWRLSLQRFRLTFATRC